MPKFQSRTAALALAALALVAFVVSMFVVPAYSSFTAALLKGALVVGFSVAYDALVLRESNTHDKIVRQGNEAYAVFHGLVILAVAVAIAGA